MQHEEHVGIGGFAVLHGRYHQCWWMVSKGSRAIHFEKKL